MTDTPRRIKPWRDADNRERLDVFNGLLLAPNYDKLFDLGYITFKSNGIVVCSKLLSSTDKRLLMLDGSTRLQKVDDRHKPYLKYHNDQCFIG